MNNDFREYSNYLMHYGIKGMHWGIRRYQNPDGTLTSEGRLHYSKYLPKPSKEYDPPYNKKQVIEKYGMDVYKRLVKHPPHKFRMETGIELIHKEPSLEELNRIMSNWLAMSDDMKKESDKKSIELFKVNNIENYLQLRKTYT